MNSFLYFNFVKKLNFRKIINLLKLFYSYIFSAITKIPTKYGMPLSISVEPTTSCNLKCPHCPVGKNELSRKKGNISLELFKKIIDQTYPYLMNLFLYFQGEPFLNLNIFELISYANKKNIFTSTSTNGHYLDKIKCEKIVNSKLDKLIISLDGIDQYSYEKYRIGGNFNLVVDGIKNLVLEKKKQNSKTPYIELQFLVLKSNEHLIPEIKKLSNNLNINKLKIKTAQIYNFEKDNLYIPNNIKYSRYLKKDGKWILKKKNKNRCWRLWNSSVITWNGDILPCCFDKDAKYSFGNIKDEKLSVIIKNKKFKNFAKQLLYNRQNIDICTNCSN